MWIAEWRQSVREFFFKCFQLTSLANLPGKHKNRTESSILFPWNKCQSYGPAYTWICLIFCEGESGRSKLERRASSERLNLTTLKFQFKYLQWEKFIFPFVLNAAFSLSRFLFTRRCFRPVRECSSSCARKTSTRFSTPSLCSNIMQMTHFSA